MSDKQFFDEQTPQSAIKAEIVSKYFTIWAKIILNNTRSRPIVYLDLFSGPGRYRKTKEHSTPLMILEKIINDNTFRMNILTIFNDNDEQHSETLKNEISQLGGIHKLQHPPQVYNYSVQENMLNLLAQANRLPKLVFADPWGYKGLSLHLIRVIMKDWGSEIIFFFNYNRISISLTNELVRDSMIDLFGKQRFEYLNSEITKDLSSTNKEQLILDEFLDALYSIGCKHVQPFRFQFEDRNTTSHYLIHISNHPLGHTRMKAVMAGISTTHDQGEASFEHNRKEVHQPLLFTRDRPLEKLEQELLDVFANKTLSMIEIYHQHNIGTNYTEKNYKEALKQLETDGRIFTNPQSSQRRKNNFGDSVMVTFPKRS